MSKQVSKKPIASSQKGKPGGGTGGVDKGDGGVGGHGKGGVDKGDGGVGGHGKAPAKK